VFETGPLSAADCVLTLLVALVPVTVIELSKLARRWAKHPAQRGNGEVFHGGN